MTNAAIFSAEAKTRVETRFGTIAVAARGAGAPTMFIHGLGQSAYFWRRQFEAFADERRCLAVDLMAHGHTEATAGRDVSFREQAAMIHETLDAMDVGVVDLVVNDSGGAIGQLMAVQRPDRIRTMAITNCDVHDNWPPKALGEMREAARAGAFADQMGAFLDDPDAFRRTIGPLVYEDPSFVPDEAVEYSVAPIVASEERKAAFNRYVGLQDTTQLVVIADQLRQLQTPCGIFWGTDDVFFPTKWAYWLAGALPGARPVIELEGAKLFFPEERAPEFNQLLRDFWAEALKR